MRIGLVFHGRHNPLPKRAEVNLAMVRLTLHNHTSQFTKGPLAQLMS